MCNFRWGGRFQGRAQPITNPHGTKRTGESKPQPKVNKAEEAAYKAFYAARDGRSGHANAAGRRFRHEIPDEPLPAGVYAQLTSAYYATGNTKTRCSTRAAKALELNPDNVDVLALLAMAIPRRVRSTTPDGRAAIAEGRGIRAPRHRIDSEPAEARRGGRCHVRESQE